MMWKTLFLNDEKTSGGIGVENFIEKSKSPKVRKVRKSGSWARWKPGRLIFGHADFFPPFPLYFRLPDFGAISVHSRRYSCNNDQEYL